MAEAPMGEAPEGEAPMGEAPTGRVPTGEVPESGTARHFGDPAGEYTAATKGIALFDRDQRPLMQVAGKAAAQMLTGVVTGRIPVVGEAFGDGYVTGAAYSTLLTPKGKVVTDLTLIRAPGDEEVFWLDVPEEGAEALREHFKKVLPPRLAKLSAVESQRRVAVVGPDAEEKLSAALNLDPSLLDRDESEALVLATDGALPTVLFRPADLGGSGWEILGTPERIEALSESLEAAGARRAGTSVWETLRVEAGRPRFGVDMTETTIPIEAGIGDRAIDTQKGCYTGQEVIVRIAHRGHVNRHLRQLHLGESPTPSPGTELFRDGVERPVGWITSAVASPRFGETLALGYVRREVDADGLVRVGSAEGAEARVGSLAS